MFVEPVIGGDMIEQHHLGRLVGNVRVVSLMGGRKMLILKEMPCLAVMWKCVSLLVGRQRSEVGRA